jgi:hypothetical protein
MLLDGHDGNGNKWPPLLDKELCEPMGVFGDRNDDEQKLLAAVPIYAMPFSKAATTTADDSKNSNLQQQQIIEGPKIMCLVYTMESPRQQYSCHSRNMGIRMRWLFSLFHAERSSHPCH